MDLIITIITSSVVSFATMKLLLKEISNRQNKMEESLNLQFQQHLKEVEKIVIEIVNRKLKSKP